jgi:hypothetical protein
VLPLRCEPRNAAFCEPQESLIAGPRNQFRFAKRFTPPPPTQQLYPIHTIAHHEPALRDFSGILPKITTRWRPSLGKSASAID